MRFLVDAQLPNLLFNKPYKLFLITTGNISNNQLLNLFSKNITKICDLFTEYHLLELNSQDIIVHY